MLKLVGSSRKLPISIQHIILYHNRLSSQHPHCMAKMMSSAYYYLFYLSSIISLVLANTEKVIFTGPPPSIIPLAKPSIEDLNLGVLTGDWRNLRVELPRIFPEKPHDASSGQSSWWLMDDLIEGKVYEMRVCWAATEPSAFELDVYEMDHVFQTPDLLASLSAYSEQVQKFHTASQKPKVRRETAGGATERNASVLFLHIRTIADYHTDDKDLMKYPRPVLVDLILDPFVFNLVPRSLIPTVLILVAGTCFIYFTARYIGRSIGKIAHARAYEEAIYLVKKAQ